MKKIFPGILLALLAAFSVSGCGGSRIADLYDNEKEISSDSNSFNLDGIQYGPGTPRKPQKQSSLMRSHYTAAN